jgi:uncharacterized protein (TIGR03118 family)
MYAIRSRHAQHRLGRWSVRWLGVLAALASLAVFAFAGAGVAGARNAHAHGHGHHGHHGHGHGHGHHGHHGLGNHGLRGHRGGVYTQRNLVSDLPNVARITDPNLVNPWGLAAGPATPMWVADNGTDVSTLYRGALHGGPPEIVPLVVSIPGGKPTGVVFNPTSDFQLTPGDANTAARFIFASEVGQITAWSPNVPPTTTAVSKVTTAGAIYKGVTLAVTPQGSRLYAADFHGAKIDVFDGAFAPVTLPPGAFTDPNLPAGYAPFNVQELGGRIYVAYAQQDAAAEDEVAGPGKGFVDVYDTGGTLIRRLISDGALNAPWGLVIAPNGFGKFGRDLLVGNFGDGRINAYRLGSGRFDGTLLGRHGQPITIEGLWALRFGNDVFAGPRALVFTAGIDDEQHGLLGTITKGRGHGHGHH